MERTERISPETAALIRIGAIGYQWVSNATTHITAEEVEERMNAIKESVSCIKPEYAIRMGAAWMERHGMDAGASA